ncbi:MarR family winged helix-turn-helix transcriptional regulator [Pseudonocardia parietis]|uniref:DNA-binding MarR family transcriptional regulator n=1 Tax=Pseudonocardia parietis TaxID=570936 RepID=A0ABS4W7B9_9PSEU|nr:MarR family transcriptional regulator [Pseudonocardia parietis]MBP2372018.1 DNA-binding MarR family transcriptional regulator [Pseudonocardia parietis]
MDARAVLDKAFELADHVSTLMSTALEERGLTPGRAEALLMLHRHGPLVQRQLATYLRCSPRHVTALVDTMEQHGWAERQRHPADRRATMVELTPQGRQHTEWMETHRDRAAQALLGEVDPTQLAAFVEVADRLIRTTGHDDSTSVDPTRT